MPVDDLHLWFPELKSFRTGRINKAPDQPFGSWLSLSSASSKGRGSNTTLR